VGASATTDASARRARRTTAPLCEVFCSFQGEGPSVGLPTAFVRAAGCPLRCSYCDSVWTYEAPGAFSIRDFDGTTIAQLDNPANASEIVDRLTESEGFGGLAELSFTGGEPLLWPGFGLELFERARSYGLRTHLETAAIDADALQVVLPGLDHLGMDWKLPSTVQMQQHGERHLECLELALESGCAVTVKIVVPARGSSAELAEALDLLADVDSEPGFELVLQPVTACHEESQAPSPDQLLDAVRCAFVRGFSPRVLPQVHKTLGFD
jgi:7-carboxy-7-deazaguanine synthase